MEMVMGVDVMDMRRERDKNRIRELERSIHL